MNRQFLIQAVQHAGLTNLNLLELVESITVQGKAVLVNYRKSSNDLPMTLTRRLMPGPDPGASLAGGPGVDSWRSCHASGLHAFFFELRRD